MEALDGWDSDRCGLVGARGSPWVGLRSPWVASDRRGWGFRSPWVGSNCVGGYGWVQIIVSGCGAVGAHEWPWFCSTWAAVSLGFGGCG